MAAVAPVLNQLTVVDAGGIGECFYFSLYGAAIFHNENYAALSETPSNPNYLPSKIIKALYGDPGREVTIRRDADFNNEARQAVAAALEGGILDAAEQNVNKFRVLADAASSESKAAAIKELGTGFRELFLRGVTSVNPTEYNATGKDILDTEGQIRHIKAVRDEIDGILESIKGLTKNEVSAPLKSQYRFISALISAQRGFIRTRLGEDAKIYDGAPTADAEIHNRFLAQLAAFLQEKEAHLAERDRTYNADTLRIIAEKGYTQAQFNADLAQIRRTRLTDFANTVDFYVINKLLENSEFTVYTHIGNPADFHDAIEFRKIGVYVYDPGRDRILTQLNLLKLAGGEHYNYFCQSDIIERFAEAAAASARTIRRATAKLAPVLTRQNAALPAHNSTLYGLMKFFDVAMFDIKDTAIFKRDLNASAADPGEWARFCGDKVTDMVKGLAFYRRSGPYKELADAELVGGWVGENEGDIMKFADRCGIAVGSEAAKVTGAVDDNEAVTTVAVKADSAVLTAEQPASAPSVIARAIGKITVTGSKDDLKAAAKLLLALL